MTAMDDLTAELDRIAALAASAEAASFLYSFGRILQKNPDHFFGSFGWGEDETAKGFGDLEKLAAAMPHLLAAVKAVLELADEAGLTSIDAAGAACTWDLDPAKVREAITRELRGGGDSGA